MSKSPRTLPTNPAETNGTRQILRTYRDWLPCALTSDEKIEKGRSLAGALEEIRNEESRAEMVKQSLKSAMASAEAKRDQLQLVVSRGEEVREIEIEEHADRKTMKVYRVRLDNGVVIHERAMTPEERQEKLPLASEAT